MVTSTTSQAAAAIPEPPPILEFRDVSVGQSYLLHAGLQNVRFSLRRGELLLVEVDDSHSVLPLAPLAQGMILPDRGEVLFEGEPWNDHRFARHASMRARIGRVFGQWGWVSNLNVLENVTLARRHHTSDPEAAIIEEADRLARQFGLDEVPRLRPAFVRPEPLRIAEWVRAFLIHPRLLLLDRPQRDVASDKLPKLVEAIQPFRASGGAVLWITTTSGMPHLAQLRPTLRLKLRGEKLFEVPTPGDSTTEKQA